MTTVLLVDDDDVVRSSVHKMLERTGYVVHSTCLGQEAVNHYRGQHSDLVITDLIMPDLDGLEVIQQLRRLDSAVKVLAISGGGRVDADEYLLSARKLGAAGVLPKPFTAEELRQAVEKALGNPPG